MRLIVTVDLGERLGGAEQMLWNFLRAVDRGRIEPIVVFLEDGPFAVEVRGLGIETHVMPAGRLRQPGSTAATIRRLAALIRTRKPELVLNWLARTHLYGAPAAAIAGRGRNVVWWQHAVTEGHALDRVATALPALAIGCSSVASARAQSTLRPRRPTFVVHPGIQPAHGGRSVGREALDLPPGVPLVGIVGRLQPWKGQDRLIEALKLLHERGQEAALVVVGGEAHGRSAGHQAHLQALAGRLGLEGSVAFTGQVADATPYVDACDVMVNASETEPFGLVLIEAMSRGKPVLAIDAGGPAEIVEHGRSGWLVPSGAPHHLADGLARLLSDVDLRERLGAEAQRVARERFSVTRMARELEERLLELAGRREPARTPTAA